MMINEAAGNSRDARSAQAPSGGHTSVFIRMMNAIICAWVTSVRRPAVGFINLVMSLLLFVNFVVTEFFKNVRIHLYSR